MFDHARGDARAPSAAGIARPVPDGDAPPPDLTNDGIEIVPEAGEHEVAVARPEPNRMPRQDVVEQPLRRADLGEIPVVILEVPERGRQRRRREYVQRVRRNRATHGRQRRLSTDQRADAETGETVRL